MATRARCLRIRVGDRRAELSRHGLAEFDEIGHGLRLGRLVAQGVDEHAASADVATLCSAKAKARRVGDILLARDAVLERRQRQRGRPAASEALGRPPAHQRVLARQLRLEGRRRRLVPDARQAVERRFGHGPLLVERELFAQRLQGAQVSSTSPSARMAATFTATRLSLIASISASPAPIARSAAERRAPPQSGSSRRDRAAPRPGASAVACVDRRTREHAQRVDRLEAHLRVVVAHRPPCSPCTTSGADGTRQQHERSHVEGRFGRGAIAHLDSRAPRASSWPPSRPCTNPSSVWIASNWIASTGSASSAPIGAIDSG